MANLFHGVGDTYAKTITLDGGTGVGQDIIIPLYLFDFSYTEEVTPIEAKGQIKGVRKTLASAEGETTSILRLSSQFANWSQLGFFLNQLPKENASVSIPVLKTSKVPDTAPYVVNDVDITSGNLEGVFVYVTDNDDPGYRTIGTAGVGEVAVAAGTITFDASDAGKSFVYTVPVTRTNVQTYGGAIGEKYGTIEFRGIVYGLQVPIWFPSLDFRTKPSLDLTGDVATLEVEFSANVDVSSGFDVPYVIYDK